MNSITTLKAQPQIDVESLQRLILSGDLKTLKPEQKVQFYNRVCETVGVNYLTKPFDYIVLNGKEVLYANKGCTEQLRQNKTISIRITGREKIDDVYVVTAEASTPDGRVDCSTGAVPLGNLKGEALANAMMKAETKAKRRVTLSICSLNMLDETEVATIPDAAPSLPPQSKQGAAQAPQQEQRPVINNPFKSDASALKCEACAAGLMFSQKVRAYYCPNFKDKSVVHSFVKEFEVEAFKRRQADPMEEVEMDWEKAPV